jgi:carbon starvation protein
LFGIANQMLAAIALCLGTTIILKMQLGAPASGPALSKQHQPAGSETGVPRRVPAFALITLIPLIWLLAVTFTAGLEKIFHPDPRIGFLAQARSLRENGWKVEQSHTLALLDLVKFAGENYGKPHDAVFGEKMAALKKQCDETWKPVVAGRTQQFNNFLDAAVAETFLFLVAMIVTFSVCEWILLLSGRKQPVLHETRPVWLPDYALKDSGPGLRPAAGAAALAFTLARELSGESQLERARQQALVCECSSQEPMPGKSDAQIYVETTERRFNGVRRCC